MPSSGTQAQKAKQDLALRIQREVVISMSSTLTSVDRIVVTDSMEVRKGELVSKSRMRMIARVNLGHSSAADLHRATSPTTQEAKGGRDQ